MSTAVDCPSGLEEWVAAIRQRVDEGSREDPGRPAAVLVLCRTSPMAEALRRAVAADGGMPGLEITTPLGLATLNEHEPLVVVVVDEVPRPDTSLTRRVGPEGERPGLEEHVAGLARAVRLHEAAGGERPETEAYASMAELADGGWGRDDTEIAIQRLLGLVGQRGGTTGAGVSASAAWDHVFAVGFGELDADTPAWERQYLETWMDSPDAERPLLPLASWERSLLAALGAQPLGISAARDPGAPLPAVELPDVAAEARLAVRLLLASRDQERTALVLVPDEATAARVRAAGQRNGLGLGEAEEARFAVHGLATVLRAGLRWFTPGEDGPSLDPSVRAVHLDRVLGSSLVGNHLPAAVEEQLVAQVRDLGADPGGEVEDAELLRFSARAVREIVQAARIVEAPLSVWLARCDELAVVDPGEDDESALLKAVERARRAMLLEARLQRLRMCVQAQVDPHSTRDHPARELDEARAGTLGALRRFLDDMRQRAFGDPLAMAILGALREEADRPASAAALARVLGGGTGTGVLRSGYDVLQYADYDGRSVQDLLLLGVHNKGLAAPPTPDPVMDDESLWALGVPGGPRRVLFQLLQALRADACAERSLALLVARDAGGRAVVPPIQLAVDPAAGARRLEEHDLDALRCETDSYGLTLGALPETRSRGALIAEVVDPAPAPDPAGTDERAPLAAQANAEWTRCGRGIVPVGDVVADSGDGDDADEPPETLEVKLARYEPLALDELMPYLGRVGDDIEWNKDKKGRPRSWSYSSGFEPLTNCLYRLFAQRVLRIPERDEISDELDPREIGNAVHGALEHSNPRDREDDGIRWRVHGDEAAVDAARQHALARLRELTTEAVEQELGALGHTLPAVEESGRGLAERWNTHWGGQGADDEWSGYVASRVKAVDALAGLPDAKLTELIQAHPRFGPLFEEASEALEAWQPAGRSKRDSRIRTFVRWALAQAIAGVDLAVEDKEFKALLKESGSGVPQGQGLAVRPVVTGASFAGLVADLRGTLDEWRALCKVLSRPILAIEPELPFGYVVDADAPHENADLLRTATLRLGEIDVPVAGKIDRVAVVGDEDDAVLQVLDYKSGAVKKARYLLPRMRNLALSQLPVYALVLRRLLEKGKPVGRIPADARVAALAYDYVKEPAASGLTDDHVVDSAELDRIQQTLDALFGRALAGEFSIVPLEDDPDGKKSWGWPRGACSLREACRFESLPLAPGLSEGSNDDEDGEPSAKGGAR